MAEEFQESNLLFQQKSDGEDGNYRNHNSRELKRKIKSKRKKSSSSSSKKSSSVPVDIPENNATGRSSWFQFVESDYFEDEFEESGDILPPHVITDRRVAGKTAFSVCSGNGRTLKGRDLSEVRNSILRMTGFLEV
ncbi:hypothetical protein LguiA_025026 [Lonicera macranthoides]